MSYFTPTRFNPTRATSICRLLAAMLVVVLATSTVLATVASLDPVNADGPTMASQQTATLGSGWYMRGDIEATEAYGALPPGR